MRLLQSEDGTSLVEFMISMAIAAIVTIGMYDLYATFSKSNLAQSDVIETQNNAQAAMDIMVKELQRISVAPTIATDTITFFRQDATGYSTGANTSTTLNDTTAAWANFAPSASVTYNVAIITGTGVGQTLAISSNTATLLNTATSWAPTPDATSRYAITHQQKFIRTVDNKLQTQIGTGPLKPIADNITVLSFSFDGVKTTTINLTARTRNPDLRLGTYQYFSRTAIAVMSN
jgi:Tfp pilus assembly protein PilW